MMITRKLTFTVPGDPIGKGRPRFVRGSGRTYTPEKTARYENLVRLAFIQEHPGLTPINSAVEINIRAYFQIPESWPKKRKTAALSGELLKVTKPDLDNIIKSITDGLNGVAWTDDVLIHAINASKDYSETPRVEVSIYYTEEQEEEQNG